MYLKNRYGLVASVALLMCTMGVSFSAHADSSATRRMMARAAPHDAGLTPATNTITTSIILNVTDPQGLARFIKATVTPGNPDFHQFMTVGEFREHFAPSNHQIRQLVRYLESFGITVDKIYPDNLDITVTGTADQLNAAFSMQLHDYVRDGRRYHRPDSKPSLSGTLAQLVLAVPGLSNEAGRFHPMNTHLSPQAFANKALPLVKWPQNGTATGIPGDYTVGDVANFYQVNPLHQAGIKGQGQTIGVMTLANFNASDVEAYWNDIGLKVKPNRIRTVLVDGGTQAVAGAGDDETSLDIEQSGGLAPEAKIRVYVAPNTGNGFLDLFYTAVSENKADSVSISWGEPEEFYFPALNGGVDYTSQLQAIDQALMEGAAQGQSFFAASGDSGAYDVSRFAPYPQFSKQLTVDAPANDPYITAAGGTTVATTVPGIPQYGCADIVIPAEQVWGWNYLNTDWAGCLGLPPDYLFSTGGGGGVSAFWQVPYYQQSVSGVQATQSGQSLIYYPNYPDTSGAQDLIDLPAGFQGRNLPDLSLNADPETGYIVVDCTDFPEASYPGCAVAGYGGTSFVAPQLNGMTVLFDQLSGGRVGLLNPVLYKLQQKFGYGPFKAFNDIAAGDNWFYQGIPGYDNGAGIGTINATNLGLTYVFLNAVNFDEDSDR